MAGSRRDARRRRGTPAAMALAAALAGCAAPGGGSGAALLADMGVPAPRPAAFALCLNNGCQRTADISLSAAEWRLVRRVFAPPPADPAEERARIATAVAVLEILAGRQAGTLDERGGSLNFLTGGAQFDCVDETVNTTTYLTMMRADGLIRFHEVGGALLRGVFLAGWPHQSASIRERGSGRVYAVDSWFFDNGTPAQVVPYRTWSRRGWRPARAPARLAPGDLARLAAPGRP